MSIPFDDRGLTLGDGLFETVLAEGGVLVLWDEHLARLTAGCAALGLPAPDPDAALAAARQALAASGPGRAAVRLTWTAGSGGRGLDRPPAPAPRLFAMAAPAPLAAGPARLATVSVRRNQASPASRLKTLSYLDNILARREAAERGADEALMLNTAGDVACAAAANIFWLDRDVLYTPALDCGVLGGIVRAKVIEAAARMGVQTLEARMGPEVLASAQAIFLTNSLIGLRSVAFLDGRAAPAHRLVQQLAQSTLEDLRGRR